MTIPNSTPTAVLYPVPFFESMDPLTRAIASHLARYKGQTRTHTESDLRAYLTWCRDRDLNPLAAQRVHVELYIRWMQEARGFKPSTISRRVSVVAGFYTTATLDGIIATSPAEHVRRPNVPPESPTLGLSHLQFEALLSEARGSANVNDFALVCMLGLLGLRIFEACGADISDLSETHGHRVLRVTGKGGKVVLGGIAFGPLVGGLLLEWFWWGSVFLINVPFALVTFLLAAMYAPAARASARTSWDLLSSVLALVGLTGLVAAIKQGAVSAPSGAFITGALATSFVCFWWFARRQRRLPTPLLDFSVFRSRSVVAGVLAAGLATFVFAGVGAVTSQHFQLVRGFSPLQSGLLLAAIAAGATVTSLLAGSVLSRVGPRRLLGAGCVVAGGGYALATLVLEANLWMFAVSLFLAGTGIGVLITVASSTIISNVSADRAGMASGVEEVSYEFGSLISVTLLGSIYARSWPVNPPAGLRGTRFRWRSQRLHALSGSWASFSSCAGQVPGSGVVAL